MYNAKFIPAEVFYKPKSTKYYNNCCMFIAASSVAVTRGGRIYASFLAGGLREPSMFNHCILVCSDDGGKTWSEPLLVIPSSVPHEIHVLDLQLYLDFEGKLHAAWMQDNVKFRTDDHASVKPAKNPFNLDCGYYYTHDSEHAVWEMICDDPDADEPVFSAPYFKFTGYMMNKPLFLNEKKWLLFAYDSKSDLNSYYITHDGGKTFERRYSGKKWSGRIHESMAYQMNDGTIRLFVRTLDGHIAESYSYDGGETFTDAVLTDIPNADSRFFLAKLPSGRVILIHNDHDSVRVNMTVRLSEDDGKTWKYVKRIDSLRRSSPDAVFHDGKIYMNADHLRTAAREVSLFVFTEEDIIEDRDLTRHIIFRPDPMPDRKKVCEAIDKTGIIATVPVMERDSMLRTAKALCEVGVKALAVRFPGDGSVSDAEVGARIYDLWQNFGDVMHIGGANVLTTEQARRTRLGEGSFAICPYTDRNMILEICNIGLVSIAGSYTFSELYEAKTSCVHYANLYPVTRDDQTKLSAAKASMPDLKVIATYTDGEETAALAKLGAAAFILDVSEKCDEEGVKNTVHIIQKAIDR